MCGRARCTLRPEQAAQACGVRPDATTVQMDRYRPSYNVSPGSHLPVVVVQRAEGSGEGGNAVVHCMKWGLVPSFTKKTDKPDHYRMFNARSESISEKASFRRLIPNNRCLVAVEGFFEWKKDGSRKQPYYIHFKDHRPLVFAALYDCWANLEGEVLFTFTILTTCSSSALQWLHDRMPVILGNKCAIDIWLNNSSKFDSVLGPYEDSDLVWYPVTPAMGKPSFDGPECIMEIQIKSAEKNPISKFFTKKTKTVDDGNHSEVAVKSSNERFFDTDLHEGLKEEEPCVTESNLTLSEEEVPKTEVSHLPKKETDITGNKTDKPEVKSSYGGYSSETGLLECLKEEEEPCSSENKELRPDLTCSEEGPETEVSRLFKKETDIIGSKRDHELLAADVGIPTRKTNNSYSTTSKKKSKSGKFGGDGQATLFSYFGRS